MEGDEEVGARFIFYGESSALVFLFLAGLIANIPVLIVYCRSKHIRSITDKFLLNLLIADLVSVALLFPSILANFLQYSSEEFRWNEFNGDDLSPSFQLSKLIGGHGETGQTETATPLVGNGSGDERLLFNNEAFLYWNWSCGLNNGLLAGLATASVLAALEIAMERYLAVVTPLHYHKFLTTPSILVTSLVGGLISIGSAVISSLDPTHSAFPSCMSQIRKEEVIRQLQKRRLNSTGISDWDQEVIQLTDQSDHPYFPNTNYYQGEGEGSAEIVWSVYVLVHLTLLFLLPVILMAFIYIRIWIEARRQKIRMTQRYKPYFLPASVDKISTEEGDLKGRSKKLNFHPMLIRFRLMDRLRATRVDRAARVAVFTLFVTILCWSPYYFVRGTDAVRNILNLSGSMGWEISSQHAPPGSGEPSWTHLGSLLPLLFASLHPLLAPIFYAYRYKRLRTEILKTVYEQISSTCNCGVDTDKINHLDSKTNRGFSSSSTFGVNPVIRQTIISQPEKSTVTPDELTSSPSGADEPLEGQVSIDLDGNERPDAPLDEDTVQPISISVTLEEDINEDEEEDYGASGVNSGSGGVAVLERKGIINYLTVWVNNYSRRWLQHRESVTSTASFITLISNKYHNNKTHPVSSV